MTQSPPSDLFTRRVCLQRNGTDAVAVRRDLAYGPAERDLRLDLYYPPDDTSGARWPAAIIVAGYPARMEPTATTLSYKDIGWTVSMCQLIALSGIAAVAYANHRDPVADLHALIDYMHESAESLRIDPARIAIVAASGNVPTALTAIMQDASRPPTCAVFSQGCLLDLDGATDVAEAAQRFGFANPAVGRTVADLRHDVPLLITRGGRDTFPAMNASIDRFVGHGLVANLPITVVNHAEGAHAFDLFEDSRTSREIVRQTLRFLQQHLTAEGD